MTKLLLVKKNVPSADESVGVVENETNETLGRLNISIVSKL